MTGRQEESPARRLGEGWASLESHRHRLEQGSSPRMSLWAPEGRDEQRLASATASWTAGLALLDDQGDPASAQQRITSATKLLSLPLLALTSLSTSLITAVINQVVRMLDSARARLQHCSGEARELLQLSVKWCEWAIQLALSPAGRLPARETRNEWVRATYARA